MMELPPIYDNDDPLPVFVQNAPKQERLEAILLDIQRELQRIEPQFNATTDLSQLEDGLKAILEELKKTDETKITLTLV